MLVAGERDEIGSQVAHDLDARGEELGRRARGRVVDGDHQVRAPGQVGQAVDLDVARHLVGDQNIIDPSPRHHFRLADLGAGDADRAGLQLAQRDLGAFVGF